MHKGFSLFLWSSSFIPQNTLPVMGPNIYIYLLPCFGWVSTHLETSGKWTVHFCNRKLKCFTTLKLWKSAWWFPILWKFHPILPTSEIWNQDSSIIHGFTTFKKIPDTSSAYRISSHWFWFWFGTRKFLDASNGPFHPKTYHIGLLWRCHFLKGMVDMTNTDRPTFRGVSIQLSFNKFI